MFYSDIKDAIRTLEQNEQRLFGVIDRIGSVPDNAFLQWFPSPCSIQITQEEWGLRLTAPPALPRDNNNCWSVIRQMELWKRYFRASGFTATADHGQRFLAEIVHHTDENLPFVPNPIEAHSMLDGLTSILGIDDNLSVLDLSVRVEPGPEYCEIRLTGLPKNNGFSLSGTDPFRFFDPENNDGSGKRINEMFLRLSSLDNNDVMGLYHLLLMEDQVIRDRLPYGVISQYYPLRKSRGASIDKYRKSLKENPIEIRTEGDTISIFSNAPLRSREQFASDCFLRALGQTLKQNDALLEPLRSRKNRLSICQKRLKPDADNLPFDAVFEKLSNAFLIPLEQEVSISYAPAQEHSICIDISPSGVTGTTS